MQLSHTRNQLRKQAGFFTDLINDIKNLGVTTAKEAKDYAKLTFPAVGLAAGTGLAYALSPRGVAENAADLSINALEKASLAEAIRDYEALKLANKLRKQNRKKLHDQFI